VAIVTPDDREAGGLSKKTGPVVMVNGPPLIVSSPPSSLQGPRYVYQVKVDDPDDDLIAFALKAHPKGMVIDKTTGVIRWEIGKGDKGNHSIEIEASDSEGALSIQKFSLTVDVK
jgi:hypothetical protein